MGIVAGQPSFGGFAVEARNVLAGFLHHLYHAVVADHVVAVREVGIAVGVERTGCGDGVALDAGDLHQSANRIARKSQVVFEAHFRRILDLRGSTAEKLAGCGGSHGAGDAHFALAADFGAGDRRVGFGDVAEQSARGQGTQDAQTRKVARVSR